MVLLEAAVNKKNLCICVLESSGPVVTLKTGAVRGCYSTVKATEQQVEEHLPVHSLGPLRLAAPRAAEPWERVRDAAEMPKMCVNIGSV